MPASQPVLPAFLGDFEARDEDPATRTLNLVHPLCRQTVCDIEPGDTLELLAETAARHRRECHRPVGQPVLVSQPDDTDPAAPCVLTASCGCGDDRCFWTWTAHDPVNRRPEPSQP